jgi:dolichol-phosphate mannosyltransferase
LSIVVPCFDEEACLPVLHERLTAAARAAVGEDYEIVLVNDGSRDRTWAIMSDLAAADSRLVAINLSRNHGHQLALTAGLDLCRGEVVLVIDADLQDPPELLSEMLATMRRENADVVYGVRKSRAGETAFKRATAHGFYRLLSRATEVNIPVDAGDFRLLSARAAAALRQMPERNRFFKGLSSWIGFRQVRVDYEPAVREHGATTWSVWTLLGLSVEGLTSFSVAPLRVASLLGVLLAVTALFFGSWIVLETLLYGKDVPGYPSLVVSVMVIGGVQLILIGVLGEYIGKMLSEIKGRPAYFVAEHSVKCASESAKSRPATPRAAE